MTKNERYLNNLEKATAELEKALNILDDSYNTGKHLVNKTYNAYAVNKVINIQSLIKELKNGYYIELNKQDN